MSLLKKMLVFVLAITQRDEDVPADIREVAEELLPEISEASKREDDDVHD